MQTLTVIKNKQPNKGEYYIKVLNSINKIENFLQVEPTRQFIDLFAKKTGDLELENELLKHFFNKVERYQHYDTIHHSIPCGLNR